MLSKYWFIDIANYDLWTDRKSKVEDRNRVLIQNFRSQLDQQLEVLHETVAASATEQEQQLKVIEEDTQLFVSTKATVKYKLFGYKQELICLLSVISAMLEANTWRIWNSYCSFNVYLGYWTT